MKKFSRCEEHREGHVLDVLADDERGLRIAVSRLGAELVSLARRGGDGNWMGFLYRDNDLRQPVSGWGNHATVMGYFLHRLKGGRSLYRGREICGGTHSFLRHKIFSDVGVDLSAADCASLTYRISPNEIAPEEYPLKVSLALIYTLAGDELAVHFRFQNHEPQLAAHLEFGLHPGFAATSFESFQFEMPPGRYRRWFSPGNYLSGETAEIEHSGGPMPFDRKALPGSYILELLDVPDRTFSYRDPPSGRRVTLGLAGVPYLTLWSDGGPFLCIEPCWGLTDRHDQRAFEEKDGIQQIGPGEELNAGFTIRAESGR
jgi:galactose mutarotase-like enzyme